MKPCLSCKQLIVSIGLALGSLSLVALPSATAAPRSVGTAVDDSGVTASIKAKLLEDPLTEGFDINVDTRRGVVTLTGGADSIAAKDAASSIAERTEGVVRVDNRIVVAPEGSEARTVADSATFSGVVRKEAAEASDATRDGWLTTKVKSQLLADTTVKGSSISVETRDRVVHLSGIVPSLAMKAEAIRIAQNTKGVLKVDARKLEVFDG